MTTENKDLDREAALAQLTPEERAAMAEDDISPEDKAAMEALAAAGDDDEDDDDDGDEDGGDAGAAGAGDGASKPDAKTDDAGDAAAAGGAEEEKGETFRPRYHVEVPADLDDQLKAIDADEAALAAKFKEGELEADAFLVEQRQLAAKRDSLNEVRRKAETVELLNQQDAQQEWAFEVKSFMRQVKKTEGIDYGANKALQDDFDAFVKMLANKPENANKDYDFYLNSGHKYVKALHGLGKAAETPKPAGDDKKTDAEKIAEAKAARKANAAAVPKTLAAVPGGDGPGDLNGNEFGNLDSLEGLAYETALAALTPAQRERYLAAA